MYASDYFNKMYEYAIILIKENQINAKMKNGVLSLEIPRMAPVKPDVKKISIK